MGVQGGEEDKMEGCVWRGERTGAERRQAAWL